jgi:hypothetical protein
MFLGAILLVSGLSYVSKLGFYADDWAFLGGRHGAKDHSLVGLFKSLGPTVQNILDVRPGQTIYQVLTYYCFGLHPLPYHVSNTLVLALVAVFFYMSLRELRLPHYVVLVVPLIYELLPHYATDRFWLAAHQAALSQALFFFGLYTALIALRCGGVTSIFLKIVSVLSFGVALLFYEVILGLLPLLVLLIGYAIYGRSRRDGIKQLRSIGAAFAYVAVAVVFLGAVLHYKMRMTDRVVSPLHSPLSMHIGEVAWTAAKLTIKFNLLHYGIGLPRVAFELYRFSGLDVLSVITAIVILVSVVVYLNWSLRECGDAQVGTNGALFLIVAGLSLFLIDYVPFFLLKSDFSYDGDSNRVTIAAAIGAACVLAGGVKLLVITIVRTRFQLVAVCGAVAAICALNFICIACFANCWARAYVQQRGIVTEVRANLYLPPGSTVLLDGFCRYVGPAPVLQNSHDATGALQIAYNDDALQADVVSPDLEIENGTIRTEAFGIERKYVYGDKLWLYDVKRMIAIQLVNSQVTTDYFERINPDKNSGCPPGREGIGSPIK